MKFFYKLYPFWFCSNNGNLHRFFEYRLAKLYCVLLYIYIHENQLLPFPLHRCVKLVIGVAMTIPQREIWTIRATFDLWVLWGSRYSNNLLTFLFKSMTWREKCIPGQCIDMSYSSRTSLRSSRWYMSISSHVTYRSSVYYR